MEYRFPAFPAQSLQRQVPCGTDRQNPARQRPGAALTSESAACSELESKAGRHAYEELNDHSDVDYRMDASLPFLYRALKP
jgi:hypothetical protein